MILDEVSDHFETLVYSAQIHHSRWFRFVLQATSALDNESEAIVQAAVDKLMSARNQTVIIIAHRLSTIQIADKVSFIGEGKILEYGSHDELISKKHGRYKRLVESSKRHSTTTSIGLYSKSSDQVGEQEDDEEIDWEAEIQEKEEKAFSAKRARSMATPDLSYMLIGAVGAVLAGGIFPIWGVLFSETMDLLFRRVEVCPYPDGTIVGGFDSCEEYWQATADDLKDRSFIVSSFWAILIAACLIGNMLTFWGFGHASERLNKRVRDSSFTALLRQEVGFFDKRSVGSITSELQDDAARIHAFSGEPVRSFIIALSSVVTGLTLSFIVSYFVL